jgi:hypothetical protein
VHDQVARRKSAASLGEAAHLCLADRLLTQQCDRTDERSATPRAEGVCHQRHLPVRPYLASFCSPNARCSV